MARLCGLAKVVSFRFRPGSIPGSGRTTTGARLLAAPATHPPAQMIVLVAAWAGVRAVYVVADSAYAGQVAPPRRCLSGTAERWVGGGPAAQSAVRQR